MTAALRALAEREVVSVLCEGGAELAITIAADPKAHTITITDNGIGMSRQEAIEHLGTIAKSGTAEFLSRLTGDQKKDAQLIGQFGVGFYSSFIVAERVEVYSRRAGLDASAGVHWQSQGEGEFTVSDVELPERGTLDRAFHHRTILISGNPILTNLTDSYQMLNMVVQLTRDHGRLQVLAYGPVQFRERVGASMLLLFCPCGRD